MREFVLFRFITRKGNSRDERTKVSTSNEKKRGEREWRGEGVISQRGGKRGV